MSSLPVIHLDTFEGPFDLLLELAQARKVAITDISLSAITEDFLKYVQQESLSPELLADFVVVAATLLLFKLREVLGDLTEEEEAEVVDLTDRVRVYRLYRERALWMSEAWLKAPLLPGPEQLPVDYTVPYPAVTSSDLQHQLQALVQRLRDPVRKREHLRPRGRSLQECMGLLVKRLAAVRRFTFTEALAGETRETQAVSFLALLEMVRRDDVTLTQENLFSPLVVERL